MDRTEGAPTDRKGAWGWCMDEDPVLDLVSGHIGVSVCKKIHQDMNLGYMCFSVYTLCFDKKLKEYLV